MSLEQSQSRLALLMDALDIPGKNLASALHVDDSLVSKWKKNHRPLTLNTPYLRPMAEFLLNEEKERGRNVITVLIDPHDQIADEIAKINFLCRWLVGYSSWEEGAAAVEPDQICDPSFFATRAQLWQGNHGRRSAVRELFKRTLSLREPQEILLLSQEPMQWLTEDKSFLEEWQGLLMNVLQKGHQVRIIHSIDRSMSSLDSILEHWLPLHLTGRIRSWFHPVYGTLPYYLTLFVVGQSLALSSVTPHDCSGPICTTLAQDPLSIKQYTSVFDSLLKQCQELIKVYTPNSLLHALEEHIIASPKPTELYIFSGNPLFVTMPRELIVDILKANKVELSAAKRLLAYYDAFSQLRSHSPVHHGIDDARIPEYLSEKALVCHDLSVLTNRTIYLTEEQRRQHIRHLVELVMKSNNFELGLCPDLGPINLVIKKNQAVLAWSDLPVFSQVAATMESTITRAFYEHFRFVWEAIPRVYRTPGIVAETLQHWHGSTKGA